MQRTLTATAAQAILARETGEVFLACLTITGAGLDTIRIVNNTQPLVRTEGTYTPYPFEAVLPEDTDAAQPQVQIRVDNVDRAVTRRLRDYEGIPKVTLEIVLASSPNEVEVGPLEFSLQATDVDQFTVAGMLGYEEDFLNQAVPAQSYTPSNSAGIFV